jgi:hypothetical protein
MTQQQANTMMKQPPNIIAQKDLMYLEDMLSWNLALCKQAKHYKMEVSDQDVINELDSIYQMHKKHYNQLLELLQNNNNQ